ncbi:hypothetical protein BGZ65_000621 [Modicella reniformis]|uniref:Uncharacterized protein n=1 Tax=Modicella reniformis TaxID=1440133 RepID=A0A9P6MJG4_9FUNG|nr:hypothetical protein BGZ65_000621 [Modicella reniformis]
MLYNPAMQPQIGGKKVYNPYPSNPPMLGSVPPGPIGMQAPLGMSGPGAVGSGGHTVYNVERRPPKSSELFDPNGPSPSSSNSGQSDSTGGFRHQGYHGGGAVHMQDGQNMMMGGERQPQGSTFHNPSFNGNSQSHSQVPPHQHHTQQQPHQSYNSVGMNRSYSSSSTGNNFNSGSQQETERAPSLSHILEIYDFDVQDDIFEELILPPNSKLRKLKPSVKDMAGQCLAVFKNANLASEALVAFQEGKETWMAPEARLEFKRSEHSEPSSPLSKDEAEVEMESKVAEAAVVEEEDDINSAQTRIQRRFNVRVWTPVLVNSTTPVVSGGTGTASPGKNQASAGVTTTATTATLLDAEAQDANGVADRCEDDHDNDDCESPVSPSSSTSSSSSPSLLSPSKGATTPEPL